MYPPCDIDKLADRGETWPVDPEMREALDQLGTDLRGEIRSVDANLHGALDQLSVDLRGEIRSGDAETRAYIDERIGTSAAETRRHFEVVGESLRSDIRAIAEGMAASREQTGRRLDEETGRTDGLAGRVLRLEVRVTGLEDDRKLRPPRRRR
jgi:hypothetical protein